MCPSKTWQHEVQTKSEDQLTELIHSLSWEIDRPTKDYGEDYWIRVFSNGDSTGNAFFVQLKGTEDIEQYRLRQSNILMDKSFKNGRMNALFRA